MSLTANAIKGVRFVVNPGIVANALSCMLYITARAIRVRKNVALMNLRIAYPDKDDRWRKEILKKLYFHLSLSIVEFLSLTKNPSLVAKWVTRVEGEEYLTDIAKKGRGLVLLAGHIGNWELLAAWLAHRGYPLVAGIRDPNDVHVSELLSSYRKKLGVDTIPKKKILLKGVKLLRQGKFIGVLADQDGGREGLKLSFMGKEASTVGGPAALSLIAGVPVVPITSYRVAPFKHEVLVLPPIEPYATMPRDDAIMKMTQRYNEILEGFIKLHPEQWLWFHRRWRA
ncbi:KDO2-lipid IV(A) lauroyltransferase [Acetomicrobium thermoterrenum DSM 13490]|jgi:KDO2-lipid IV(A) lauroyltransferase|uniref:KDO2-lipid IV(A) lauroyltransferase n=1 Tax=Acetomicrobium thermoterrenum DSM 13490 TaxID=1120987 RepID=A0A1H3HBF6_9BACT|nr:lysophospholipid acyltransferase family protein [Acetomicrobium thermoterrenum]SDY12747.1 KDO2-lipid IV(A) lauroyltransferase [Acetomicrobium thermoterrenum DSM 13490]